MLVKELIERLKKAPQNAKIIKVLLEDKFTDEGFVYCSFAEIDLGEEHDFAITSSDVEKIVIQICKEEECDHSIIDVKTGDKTHYLATEQKTTKL